MCNEEEIKTMADAMVSTGMHALGYEYINLDDCWRSADGRARAFSIAVPKETAKGGVGGT